MKVFEITSSEQLEHVKMFLAQSADRAQNDGTNNDRRRAVEAIIQDVRTRGDAALVDYTKRFAGVSL